MNQAIATPASSSSDDEFLVRLALALDETTDRKEVIDRFAAEAPQRADEVRQFANDDGLARSAFASSRQLHSGDRLGGFRIVRLIAVGGMGEVYEAEQESLTLFQPRDAAQQHRRVAIKVIRRGQISNEYLERFLREQGTLARLHQTHIVPVLTAGEDQKIAYFVMPYIEGAALNHVMNAAHAETKNRHNTPTLGELASRFSLREISYPTSMAATLPPAAGGAIAAEENNKAARTALAAAQVRGESGPLSQRYFRSVAEVVAEAAEAVQHAHDAKIIHRDLKPSNLMVDADGHSWIIDFGLAGTLSTSESPSAKSLQPEYRDCTMRTLPGLLGTVPYLAPEQLEGRADHRSDVYGLGATLYELCTWRPPFSPVDRGVLDRIREGALEPPLKLTRQLPAELDAICRRAMARLPEQRYATARELADDLRRWLRHEPTDALPIPFWWRLWLWARRNPGWAAATAAIFLALCVTSIALAGQVRAAQALAKSANDREQLAKIERMQAAPRRAGGFDELWQLVRDSEDIGRKVDLRGLAAAALARPDARLERRFEGEGSSLTFDRDSKAILMGGTPRLPARLWNGSENEPTSSNMIGAGPVAFGPAGEPLQLLLRPERKLVLWNVAQQQPASEFQFPEAAMTIAAFELSPEAQHVAAVGHAADEKSGLAVVWQRESGKELLKLAQRMTALAFSPDNRLVALGNDGGRIEVRNLADGSIAISNLSADRATVTALAFGRDPRTASGEEGVDNAKRWLLAAGDGSGTIVIWDAAGRVRAICRGSSHNVHSLAFSPDGMTLGSVGRGSIRLWDTTTGVNVLDIHESNWLTDLEFSPDGRFIAVSSLGAFDDVGQVSVWKLEPTRGIDTLRGLGQPIATVILSPDNRHVAAISHDSRIGLWDRQTGRLLHVFEAPKSTWVDNCALMFSPDGTLLAHAGSVETASHARLWNVATGEEVGSWTLPPGLNQSLAFPRPREALLFQVEIRSARRFPDSATSPRDEPRVGRLYDLVAERPGAKRGWELTEFPWTIEYPLMPEGGRFIVVKGMQGASQPTGRVVKAFDAATGAELYAGPLSTEGLNVGSVGIMLDREGKFLTDEGVSIVELPSGKFLGVPRQMATAAHRWHPDMPYLLDLREGLMLVPKGRSDGVLQLDREGRSTTVRMPLSADGTLFAWGASDGTVYVCNLPEIRRRLTVIGLGW
jgi:serine/threonine protein kinase/WD40 repeat protein